MAKVFKTVTGLDLFENFITKLDFGLGMERQRWKKYELWHEHAEFPACQRELFTLIWTH